MICLSETYLDSSNVDDDPWLNLKDFTLIRADNLYNCQIVGVLVFILKDIWPFTP